MIRDGLKSGDYWSRWIDHYIYEISHRKERLGQTFVNESYRPQYMLDLSRAYLALMLHSYSSGDSVPNLAGNIEPLLCNSEETQSLGNSIWTEAQRRVYGSWPVNLDFYIECFWLVGLALSLDIPDSQWNRLLALIGNEGEDALLDRIIATRQPNRKIGASLCYPKPYASLLRAIEAPKPRQAALLENFLDRWYLELGVAAGSIPQKQAIACEQPYWYGCHRMEGGYFGYWCIEAVAAVKAFSLDDSRCMGHPHYPGDLLRIGVVTPPDLSRLPPELAASVGADTVLPFAGEPQTLTNWQLFKLVVMRVFSRR